MLATTAANVVFWAWPVAPPRLAVPKMTDILVTHDILGAADPHGATSLVNLYAAMPSLHVAWAAWCATAIVITTRSRWRHLAWLYPAATTLVVLASAKPLPAGSRRAGSVRSLEARRRPPWSRSLPPTTQDHRRDHPPALRGVVAEQFARAGAVSRTQLARLSPRIWVSLVGPPCRSRRHVTSGWPIRRSAACATRG